MRLKSPHPQVDGGPAAAEKPTAYRTLGSLVTGVLLVVFGAVFFFAFALGSEKHSVGATIGLLMVAAGVVGGLYPAAFSHADRLVIRNPFRTIVVSWPRVESVSAKLSMVVQTIPEEGRTRKFTIWAIPVSMHERRKSDKEARRRMRSERTEAERSRGGRVGGFSGAGLGVGAGLSGARRRGSAADPIETMAFADQAVQEMKDRIRICPTPKEKATATTVSWTWFTLAPMAAVIGVLIAAIAGAF